MSLKILPRFNFLENPTKQQILGFEKWVSENELENLAEVAPPKIYYGYLKSTLNVLAVFGNDLGYDLSRRMPQISQVHLLSLENFTNHIKKTDTAKPGDIAGYVTSVTNNVYIKWKPEESIFKTMATTQHELTHQLSSKNVWFNPVTSKFRVGLGYSIPPESKYKIYSESVAEMINIHLCKKYWPKYANLNKLVFEKNAFSYLKERLFIKNVIDSYTKSNPLDKKVILRSLIRGLFTGDISFFDRYPIFSKIS